MLRKKDTKQKGDIAESLVRTKLLMLGFSVAKPVGDRKAYDLLVDAEHGNFIRVQVKGCFTEGSAVKSYKNRIYASGREKREYPQDSFDFLIVYCSPKNSYYVIPATDFLARRCFIPFGKYADDYLERWDFLKHWATIRETAWLNFVKVGEPVNVAIPSQAPTGEGVETVWQTPILGEETVQTTKQSIEIVQ